MTGVPGSSNWSVYASTNLAATNWTLLASNLTMNATTGNNSFTDNGVSGASKKFYVVSKTNSTSQTIGFYNQTIAHGTNLVADQLYQVDDNILNVEYNGGSSHPMNTLYPLFAISNAWGSAQSGTRIFKWNGSGFVSATNTGPLGPSWVGDVDMTLLPGASVLMYNTNSHSFTNTFVGLVRGEQIFHIAPGSYYLSATAPIAGNVTNITEYIGHSADILRFWSTNTQSFVSHTNIGGTWSNGGLTNNLNVGDGFVLITTNTFTWTNTWQ
jgi:hypothetical protein